MKKKDENNKFKLINKICLHSLAENCEIPKSDLALQSGDWVWQFKYESKPKKTKKIIRPGSFMLKSCNGSLKLAAITLGKKRLLLDSVNSKSIVDEADRFFSKLHIYEQLERQKKRGVLIYSSPGMGKTSTIAHFCTSSMINDPGTVVVVWPTSKIDADEVTDFFAVESKFHSTCTRMILILEDIGGSEYESGNTVRGVDSGILNLLDGVSVNFKLPTFIVATTNHPQNLLSSLSDRPGRFDLMIELKPPMYQERIALLEFIAKRSLSEDEKAIFSSKECDTLSIAHLDEIIVRSLLHDKSLRETLREILDHKKNVSKEFEKKRNNLGIGFSSMDEDF